MLKHEAILWGKKQGKKAFILGGGYDSKDGIYKYKLSFSPEGKQTFRVMQRIHNKAHYNTLVNKRRIFEQRSGVTWDPDPSYFPAYRSPNINI